MSRTDHHRPYRVQVADPLCPYRYRCDYVAGLAYPDSEWAIPYTLMVSPPADYRRAVFHGPQRRAVRDWARDSVRRHRSGMEIEPEPEGRARNSAKWMWW